VPLALLSAERLARQLYLNASDPWRVNVRRAGFNRRLAAAMPLLGTHEIAEDTESTRLLDALAL